MIVRSNKRVTRRFPFDQACRGCMLAPCMHRFPPTVQRHALRLSCFFKIPKGVKVSMSGCLSLSWPCNGLVTCPGRASSDISWDCLSVTCNGMENE